jgi:hypothetical protein
MTSSKKSVQFEVRSEIIYFDEDEGIDLLEDDCLSSQLCPEMTGEPFKPKKSNKVTKKDNEEVK